jgi:NADH:ubiquinone reductase (H+-translocating)
LGGMISARAGDKQGAEKRPTVVIVGAGFGGLTAARALRRVPVNVVLIDRHNYHLFQPLLYQVATAGLEPSDIARPVRAILRGQPRFDFRMTQVSALDLPGRHVLTDDGPVAYDFLILALGGETNYFGLENIRRSALALKTVDDAIAIRNHVLRRFEAATHETNLERRAALRTFVIVGGGPTGVEMAGALSELSRLVLGRDYPRAQLDDVRILLLEAGNRLLATMPERLSTAAARTLRRKQVDVRLEAAVQDYDGERVCLRGGEIIPAATLIWAAGIQAATSGPRLGLPTGRQGRVAVDEALRVPGHEEVYVIGDAAAVQNRDPYPMVAPVAIQMAQAAARNINRHLNASPPIPFRYRDKGTLATIGRNAAVADVHGIAFTGFLAWVVWLVVHIVQLIGFRNRVVVLVNWAWDYFFYERAARLITGE